MMQPFVATYADCIESCQDFLAANNISSNQQVIRRAIQTAYREIVSARDWKCMVRNGRIHLKAAQTTGTITYTHTGGAYERQLTLVGATWPSWAIDAAVRIGDVVCDVETVESDTVLTLDATLNPGEDIAAGSTYTLYPRWYSLPAGFASMSGTLETQSWLEGEEISLAEIFARDRYDNTPGDIRWYAIGPAQDLYGSMALYVHPASDADETLDFAYKSRPRNIRYSGVDANDYIGTISVNGTTVTGSSTVFSADHVGSVLRISSSSTKPTGVEGANPYADQRTIIAYTSPTSVTLDATTTARSGVKYVVTDPIDIDISLFDAFMRCCEKHLVSGRDLKNRASIISAADEALFRAKCADGRSTQRQVVGGGGYAKRPLRQTGTIGGFVD